MEQAKIDRINVLARKSKAEGLTEAEREEQAALRREYVAAVKRNLTAQLERTAGMPILAYDLKLLYVCDRCRNEMQECGGRGQQEAPRRKAEQPSGKKEETV